VLASELADLLRAEIDGALPREEQPRRLRLRALLDDLAVRVPPRRQPARVLVLEKDVRRPADVLRAGAPLERLQPQPLRLLVGQVDAVDLALGVGDRELPRLLLRVVLGQRRDLVRVRVRVS
tara:strand:- start:1074 stop:1439 length:366 start_codon:yes stop_codon:yes gene_type:complete